MDFETEFPILGELNFLNHAGVSPIPSRTAQAMRELVGESNLVGPYHFKKHYGRLDIFRENAARLIGCNADEVAFVKNTTEGLMLVAEGIEWESGDNVVTCAHEFPANVYPWRSLKRRGVSMRVVNETRYKFRIEDFVDAIDERTRLLTVSAVQFSTGFRMPIQELAQLCRARNVLFCVDAIQALGAMPFKAREWGIDFLSADGHKWMLGPEGFGLFYCRRERVKALSGCVLGWIGTVNPQNYDRTDQEWSDGARRFEEGSHNLIGGLGLAASVGLLLEVGLDNVERRILQLTRRLINGLEKRGCQVFTPGEDERRLGIVAFRHPTVGSGEIFKHLFERKIVTAHRRGWVRVSPHFYCKESQIDAVLKAMDEC